MPDRFTYLPMIGVTVALVWLLASLAGAWRWAGWSRPLPRAGGRGADGLHLAANRLLARQRNPLAPYPGVQLAKRPRPEQPGRNAGRAREARRSRGKLRQGMKIDPEYVNAQVNLAELLLAKASWMRASTYSRKILRKHPDDFDAQFGIALALMRQQRCDEATTHFRMP